MRPIYGVKEELSLKYFKFVSRLPAKEEEYFLKIYSMFNEVREIVLSNKKTTNYILRNIEDEFSDISEEYISKFIKKHIKLITHCIYLFRESSEDIKNLIKITKKFESAIILWIEFILIEITEEVKKYFHLKLV